VNELEDMIPTLKEKNESQDWLQDVIRHTKQTPFYVDDPSPRPPASGEEDSAPPYIPKPPESDPPPLVIPPAKEPSHAKPLNLKDFLPPELPSGPPVKRTLTTNSQPANVAKGKEPRGDSGDMALDSKVGKIDLAHSDTKGTQKSPKRPVVFNKKGEKDSTKTKV